jgi:hypothetical protein
MSQGDHGWHSDSIYTLPCGLDLFMLGSIDTFVPSLHLVHRTRWFWLLLVTQCCFGEDLCNRRVLSVKSFLVMAKTAAKIAKLERCEQLCQAERISLCDIQDDDTKRDQFRRNPLETFNSLSDGVCCSNSVNCSIVSFASTGSPLWSSS